MEIERKYLVNQLPQNLSSYPCLHLEQAYLCTEPVIRIRREDRLLLLAAVGGSVGALIGMLLFRHKIRKPKFFLGVPVILGLQLALFFAVWLLAQRYL